MIKQTITNSLLFLLLCGTSLNSLAQEQKEISPLDMERPVSAKVVVKKPLNQEQIYQLNEALRTQNYSLLYDILNKSEHNKDYFNFLNSKISEGHPPIYWLLADYYSGKNNLLETHKWYYIAIIMTQQDSALCLDGTARYAAQKILKTFPEVLSTTRGSPQFINQAMTEVNFFIESLKQRANPQWACSYGDRDYLYNKDRLIPEREWQNKRLEILKKYTENFNK